MELRDDLNKEPNNLLGRKTISDKDKENYLDYLDEALYLDMITKTLYKKRYNQLMKR